MNEITRQMLETYSLQAVLQIAWANSVQQSRDEIVSGLPRSRWQQFDASKDYWE